MRKHYLQLFKSTLLRQAMVALAIVAACVPALADKENGLPDFEVDGVYYTIINEFSVEISYDNVLSFGRANCQNSHIVLDSDSPVVDNEEEKEEEITKPIPNIPLVDSDGVLRVPMTVTYDNKTYNICGIGYTAFINVDKIRRIELTSNIKYISAYAFANCKNLEALEFTSALKEIGNCAFSGCSSLRELNIPNTLECHGATFAACKNLEKVTYDAANVILPKGIFSGCDKLTEVFISPYITEIGEDAFSGCTSLRSITIPKRVNYIGNNAFLKTDLQIVTLQSATPVENLEKGFPTGTSTTATTFCVPLDALNGYMEKYADYFNGYNSLNVSSNDPRMRFSIAPKVTGNEMEQRMAIDNEMAMIANPIVGFSLYWIGIGAVNVTDLYIKFNGLTLPGTEDDIKIDNSSLAQPTYSYDIPKLEGACTMEVNLVKAALDTITDNNDMPDVFNIYRVDGSTIVAKANADTLRELPAGLYIISDGKTSRKIAL